MRRVIGWAGRWKQLLARGQAHRCDFCDDDRAEWVYPHPDAGPLSLAGAWWACAACHPLIEHGDRQGLAERAAAHLGWPDSSEAEREAAAVTARERHDRFFNSRPSPRGYRAA